MRDAAATHPIHSEEIEPVAALLIGRLFVRCETAKTNNPNDHFSALQDLWFGLHGLESIAIAARTATHFSLTLNDHINVVARYIEEETGIDPTTAPDWKWR